MSQKKDRKAERDYTTVNIPWVLAERIDKVIESKRGGYVSRVDFVLDSLRRRLKDFDMIE